MSLRIIKGGMQDTLQDLGRYGHQYLGINPTGAMDTFAASVANALVGNRENEAVIEVHFPAAEIIFEQPALISICGADFTASINGDEVPCRQPILVGKYSILQFYRNRSGARAYIAIGGGLHVVQWLDSYSTHLKVAAGGYMGRPLQKDDVIHINSDKRWIDVLGKKEFHVFPWKADMHWGGDHETILVMTGNEWEELTGKSKERFAERSFVITSQSDRMGYRLEGKSLSVKKSEELVSSAVCFGTVQLLPDGNLIVLMADHQTTGGYPRIAHVISAHHSRLAQLHAGNEIHFSITDQLTAERLLLKQRQHLLQLQNACTFKLDEFLS